MDTGNAELAGRGEAKVAAARLRRTRWKKPSSSDTVTV
jgi:hypothetical protein